MSYLFEHTVFFDGQFRILTLILIVAAIAVVAYCVTRVLLMKKELKELQKTAAGSDIAGTASDIVPDSQTDAAAESSSEIP